MTYIYTIAYPTDFDKEEFSGIFSTIELEGIEERDYDICIYLSEKQTLEGELLIHEICSNFKTTFTKTILENKNWNEQWESNFQPILIDNFVNVRATFHSKNESVEHEIIIEPKMSFGTGHHPTTAQMMQNMRQINFKNTNVLDCGSGTGILAILAEKLGAKMCIALDNDEWCFKNCIENIALNNAKIITPQLGDLEKVKTQIFDIILANIHRNFLVENQQQLSSCLKENGFLLVSGFYTEDAKIILEKGLECNLIANYETSQNNWECIVFQKK